MAKKVVASLRNKSSGKMKKVNIKTKTVLIICKLIFKNNLF